MELFYYAMRYFKADGGGAVHLGGELLAAALYGIAHGLYHKARDAVAVAGEQYRGGLHFAYVGIEVGVQGALLGGIINEFVAGGAYNALERRFGRNGGVHKLRGGGNVYAGVFKIAAHFAVIYC